MKFTTKLIASAVLLATTSAFAIETDSTDITINVTKDEFVNFSGSLQGTQTVSLTTADVDGGTQTLGDLGVESNTSGDCTVAFSSVNDFKLKHTTAAVSTFLHGAAQYTLDWSASAATIASGAATNTFDITGCVHTDSDLVMNPPSLPAGTVLAGIYSDVVTVTVTTQ